MTGKHGCNTDTAKPESLNCYCSCFFLFRVHYQNIRLCVRVYAEPQGFVCAVKQSVVCQGLLRIQPVAK